MIYRRLALLFTCLAYSCLVQAQQQALSKSEILKCLNDTTISANVKEKLLGVYFSERRRAGSMPVKSEKNKDEWYRYEQLSSSEICSAVEENIIKGKNLSSTHLNAVDSLVQLSDPYAIKLCLYYFSDVTALSLYTEDFSSISEMHVFSGFIFEKFVNKHDYSKMLPELHHLLLYYFSQDSYPIDRLDFSQLRILIGQGIGQFLEQIELDQSFDNSSSNLQYVYEGLQKHLKNE